MRVLLFGTCLVDTFFPEAGEATVRLLRRFGAEPVFPKGQTCCGQPAFNAGYEAQARAAAEHFLWEFDGDGVRFGLPHEHRAAAGGGAVSHEQTSLKFRENTVRALEDSALRAAMKQAADTFGTKRADAFAPVADLEALRERIFGTPDDLFAAESGAPPTNLTLVTGPSRTADIELTLAIGVHGPERLDILA